MPDAPRDPLHLELRFYAAHKAEWLNDHCEEFVVVKGSTLLGFFASFRDAYYAGAQRFGYVDFLVKQVLPQEQVFAIF